MLKQAKQSKAIRMKNAISAIWKEVMYTYM